MRSWCFHTGGCLYQMNLKAENLMVVHKYRNGILKLLKLKFHTLDEDSIKEHSESHVWQLRGGAGQGRINKNKHHHGILLAQERNIT